MNFFNNINLVTAIMTGLFLAPVVAGIISPYQDLQLQRFIRSLLSNTIILASIILSLYLASVIRADHGGKLLAEIFKAMPPLQTLATSGNIWIYALSVLLLTVIMASLLHLLIMPVFTYAIAPAINSMASSFRKKGGIARRMAWGLSQLPKSILYVIVLSLVLNVFTNFSDNLEIDKTINQSATYQFVNSHVLNPLFRSSIVKDIPVLLNESFKDASASLQNVHLTYYFNGMTLSDAIKSNPEIDNAAKGIAGKATSSKDKAYLIYQWVSKSIRYDNNKAAVVMTNPAHVASGAIVAFNTRTGICFDYACLYVAMCRAVDVKVRFITGMGYSGVAWGDHAWNQVYYPAENRWINVDPTFGNSGMNFFDRANFGADHQGAVIQGEW